MIHYQSCTAILQTRDATHRAGITKDQPYLWNPGWPIPRAVFSGLMMKWFFALKSVIMQLFMISLDWSPKGKPPISRLVLIPTFMVRVLSVMRPTPMGLRNSSNGFPARMIVKPISLASLKKCSVSALIEPGQIGLCGNGIFKPKTWS